MVMVQGSWLTQEICRAFKRSNDDAMPLLVEISQDDFKVCVTARTSRDFQKLTMHETGTLAIEQWANGEYTRRSVDAAGRTTVVKYKCNQAGGTVGDRIVRTSMPGDEERVRDYVRAVTQKVRPLIVSYIQVARPTAKPPVNYSKIING